MKIEELARPGIVVFGLAGIVATALLGYAAGVVVSRDPESVRRAARRVVGAAAFGLERATLMAAQAREHVGDLWAEAREAAIVDVDAADFTHAAARASKGPRTAAGGAAEKEDLASPKVKPARKRTTRPRKTGGPKSNAINGVGDRATGRG